MSENQSLDVCQAKIQINLYFSQSDQNRIFTGHSLDSQGCKVLHTDKKDWLDSSDAYADLHQENMPT